MAFTNTKGLPFYEMEKGLQEAERDKALKEKLRNKSLDVYNMCGVGGPSFCQVTNPDLDNSSKLYGGRVGNL